MSDVPTEGLWLSISELASQRGVSTQAVSKRVKRLEGLGHLRTRKGPGGTKLVNLAEFDRAAAQTEDGLRALNGGGKVVDDIPTGAPGSPVLAKEQARKTAYEADLRQLDLDERLGKLVPVEQVRDAYADVGEALSRIFDGLSDRVDEILSIAARDGKAAAKAYLKGIGRDARRALAKVAGEQASLAAEAGA